MDASPWGLGAYIAVNGVTLEFFKSAISAEEARILGMEIGSSSSQQAAEALVALVALRLWKSHWLDEGTTLRVKSDSVAPLILVVKLKTSGSACGIIAREVALAFVMPMATFDGRAYSWLSEWNMRQPFKSCISVSMS